MQKVLTPIRDLGLQIPGLPGTLFALMFRYPPLLIPIPAWGFDLATIRTRGQGFQPKINSNVPCASRWRFFRNFHDKINVPAATGILTETAAFDRAGEFPAVPETAGMTGITYCVINDFNARCFESRTFA